jgi:hypothetical protein
MICCSKCRTLSNNYRKDHLDKCKSQQRDYYKRNAEYIKDRQKKYSKDNTEYINDKRKKYREEHTEQITAYYEDKKRTNPLTTKFKNMIHRSMRNDKKYNRIYDDADYIDEAYLNKLWINQVQLCFYQDCNCIMTLDFTTTTHIPTQISVQRLNNDLPHIKSNCVLSCLSCNLKRKELKLI